jgi:hypothetical protein
MCGDPKRNHFLSHTVRKSFRRITVNFFQNCKMLQLQGDVQSYCAKNPSLSLGQPVTFVNITDYISKWLGLPNIFGNATKNYGLSPRQ